MKFLYDLHNNNCNDLSNVIVLFLAAPKNNTVCGILMYKIRFVGESGQKTTRFFREINPAKNQFAQSIIVFEECHRFAGSHRVSYKRMVLHRRK